MIRASFAALAALKNRFTPANDRSIALPRLEAALVNPQVGDEQNSFIKSLLLPLDVLTANRRAEMVAELQQRGHEIPASDTAHMQPLFFVEGAEVGHMRGNHMLKDENAVDVAGRVPVTMMATTSLERRMLVPAGQSLGEDRMNVSIAFTSTTRRGEREFTGEYPLLQLSGAVHNHALVVDYMEVGTFALHASPARLKSALTLLDKTGHSNTDANPLTQARNAFMNDKTATWALNIMSRGLSFDMHSEPVWQAEREARAAAKRDNNPRL